MNTHHSGCIIGKTETAWVNPAIMPPPFDMKLLLMVGGSISDDCGRTWQRYTHVFAASIRTTSPGDAYDDITAIDEYLAGDRTDFLQYQFYLLGGDEAPIDDWCSDSIIAWAYYPLGVAQLAVDAHVERERSAE
jgi:hypothetical protein